jgi:hypothetical protein
MNDRIIALPPERLRSAKLFLSLVPLPIELLEDCPERRVSRADRIVKFQRRPHFRFSLGNDVTRGERPSVKELQLKLRHRCMRRGEVGLTGDRCLKVLNRGFEPFGRLLAGCQDAFQVGVVGLGIDARRHIRGRRCDGTRRDIDTRRSLVRDSKRADDNDAKRQAGADPRAGGSRRR